MDESIRDPAILLRPDNGLPPHMADAYRYWLNAREDGAVPHRRMLDPTLIPVSALRWVGILEPVDGGRDYLVRLTGSGVANTVQADLTNARVSEMPGIEAPVERLRWATENRKPYLTSHPLTWAVDREFIDYNVLVLPFADGTGAVARLLMVFSFDFLSSGQQ